MDEPGPQPRVLLADKGYDADFIRQDLDARGVAAIIPAKRSRKVQPVIDRHVYAPRNLVEHGFSKLNHSRRLATRYDKTADSFLGFILIASIRLWVSHFAHTTHGHAVGQIEGHPTAIKLHLYCFRQIEAADNRHVPLLMRAH